MDKENVDLSVLKNSVNDYYGSNKETDPDLIISYEVVDLPSKGLFYREKFSTVNVEYLTSKDEDLLTTPSLNENGTVLDYLLKRKVKNCPIPTDQLLTGDINAIILFLRSSSYGTNYTVTVYDPRTNTPFKETIDLLNLKSKEIKEMPDSNFHFNVYIPMRKKNVKFRLLTSGEEKYLLKQAESLKELYNEEYAEYNTLRLKASIVSINDNNDRSYIEKFVDAMPALDAYTIRKKINDVSPDIDMKYEFTAKDGYKFWARLDMGIDFFFPET